MRTVNIAELESHLSGYLQSVRDGEELIVQDRSVPVARILPFRQDARREREQALVASGALKMPEKEMDWEDFFSLPSGNVPHDVAVRATIEGRGDQ